MKSARDPAACAFIRVRRPAARDVTVPHGFPFPKSHHAAFDAHLIGIDPEYKGHVAERLRAQDDGPMLETRRRLHLSSLHLPGRDRDQTDRDRLAFRPAAQELARGSWRSRREAYGFGLACCWLQRYIVTAQD